MDRGRNGYWVAEKKQLFGSIFSSDWWEFTKNQLPVSNLINEKQLVGISESFARLSEEQPFEANEIWLKILERSAPSYPEKPIQRILVNLTAEGEEGKRVANKTIDEYIKQGIERPRKLLIEILNKS